jgi:hypothetical protein
MANVAPAAGLLQHQGLEHQERLEQQQQQVKEKSLTTGGSTAALPAGAAAATEAAAKASAVAAIAAAAASTTPSTQPSAIETAATSYLAAQARPPLNTAASYWSSWKPGPRYESVRQLSPDVFKLLPREFNPDYRNPCWGSGPDLVCIPYFHIIGAWASGGMQAALTGCEADGKSVTRYAF